jgi:hypothetical protein
VIVYVGAENMFALVNAVVGTSIALPVKTRIAEGLSRAGASNTLKVVAYNCILGPIAVLSHGAIRQFCAFAIVVLVAHWSLVHTFFIAVLSIDIQRLEVRPCARAVGAGLMWASNSSTSSSARTRRSRRRRRRRASRSGWARRGRRGAGSCRASRARCAAAPAGT